MRYNQVLHALQRVDEAFSWEPSLDGWLVGVDVLVSHSGELVHVEKLSGSADPESFDDPDLLVSHLSAHLSAKNKNQGVD